MLVQLFAGMDHVVRPRSSSAPALQIFDKALVETTFTAMYAQFCSELNKNLPEFEDPDSEDGKMLTFRRILLNKCQVCYAQGFMAACVPGDSQISIMLTCRQLLAH